jgi:hypothetical protein
VGGLVGKRFRFLKCFAHGIGSFIYEKLKAEGSKLKARANALYSRFAASVVSCPLSVVGRWLSVADNPRAETAAPKPVLRRFALSPFRPFAVSTPNPQRATPNPDNQSNQSNRFFAVSPIRPLAVSISKCARHSANQLNQSNQWNQSNRH